MAVLRCVLGWMPVYGWGVEPLGEQPSGVRWEAAPYTHGSLIGWPLRRMCEAVRAAVHETCGPVPLYVGPRLVSRRGDQLGGMVPDLGTVRGAPMVSLMSADPVWVAYHEAWHYRHGKGEAEADAYACRMTGRGKPL